MSRLSPRLAARQRDASVDASGGTANPSLELSMNSEDGQQHEEGGDNAGPNKATALADIIERIKIMSDEGIDAEAGSKKKSAIRLETLKEAALTFKLTLPS